jgi:hydrogenase expression/formation protein HypD
MLRVPGSRSSLERERAKSGNVRVAYSPLDALSIARANPAKSVIFLAVGFETTAPTIALSILEAKKEKLKNIFFLSALKLIPAAMRYLLLDKRVRIDGFLCPGHVSAVIGTKEYAFVPKKYKIPCCVTGFEPLDILEGIYMILEQLASGKSGVANQYTRVVTKTGNLKAQGIIRRVFKTGDSEWRGLGIIPKSGLKLKNEFSDFDASRIFFAAGPRVKTETTGQCRCSDILKGLILPRNCPLFAKKCRPEHPLGPCMVSSEGACNAYYKFRGQL